MSVNLDNVIRYISAGFKRLDGHRLDGNGLPAGLTGSVTPGAQGVGAFRITAVQTANVNIPTATLVPVTGDNDPQGTFAFSSDAARGFDVAFAEDDFQDREAMQGIKYRDIGNHSFAGRDIVPFDLKNLLLLGTSNAKAQSSVVRGLEMYAGVLMTRAQMSARGRDGFTQRQAAAYQGSVVLNAGDSYPWGETFQQAIEGYTAAFVQDWTARLPVTIHRWTGTSATKYYFAEIPASTDLDDILIYTIDSNGNFVRKTTGVTIDTSDRSATFSPAPNGLDIVAYYMYTPSN
jgi:hypothetical protein